MRAFALCITLLSFHAFGKLHRPPNISQARGEEAVFVDFRTASYQVVYDLKTRKAYVESEIEFEQLEVGYPIFDLIPEALSSQINNTDVEIGEIDIEEARTKVRMVKKKLLPGLHVLKIKNRLQKNVRFDTFPRSLRSAFWISDLSKRSFLEQYFPTNFEYDQFPVSINVKVLNSTEDYLLMVNGTLEQKARHEWSVQYPAHFATSSLFFHLFPKDVYQVKKWTFKGKEKQFPVTLYGRTNLQPFEKLTNETLQELEADYGAWPHDALVIYATGMSGGGMEYHGATMTSHYALAHELIHSYFARGMMPANGNAGWVDEAIASWRDNGYPEKKLRDLTTTSMAGYSPYWRTTDRYAYTRGASFIGHLHSKFKEQGGFKVFLKDWKERQLFTPYLTPEFQGEVERYFSADLGTLFDTYVYGKGKDHKVDEDGHEENPFHPDLSEQEWFELL